MPKDTLRGASRMQTTLESGPMPRNGPIAAQGNGEDGIVLCILLLAQGILRCLSSETTTCFLFPRTLDQAVAGSRSQHWRGITQRVGNGSRKRRASISCPPFLRGNSVVGGSLPAPSKCHGVVGQYHTCAQKRFGYFCIGVIHQTLFIRKSINAGNCRRPKNSRSCGTRWEHCANS